MRIARRQSERTVIVALGFLFGLFFGVEESRSDPLDPYDHIIGCGYDQEDGTSGNDRLVGSETTRDTIRGFAGDDVIKGLACGDTLSGGGNVDNVFGAKGNDTIDLGDGHDGLNVDGTSGVGIGGLGHDYLTGGLGGDLLGDNADGPVDIDRLFGDDGNDGLYVDDGDTSDTASCGTGGGDVAVTDSGSESGPDCESRFP